MNTTVEIDAERPQELIEILRPSLSSDDTVQYELVAEEDKVRIEVVTEDLGPLRGCTDTVFRLTTLARKLY
jgi:tRNA threonylcarbamoyladenosine modification (KEOPS) complex  Pcc1 subunit